LGDINRIFKKKFPQLKNKQGRGCWCRTSHHRHYKYWEFI